MVEQAGGYGEAVVIFYDHSLIFDVMENNELINGVNIIFLNARLNAIENILWGYLNVELAAHDANAPKELRKEFLRFYLEHIRELKKELPPALADNPYVKKKLLETENSTLQEIEELG